MLKYTLLSPLIQNILENISLPSLERSLNYISLPLMLKPNNLAKKYNLTHFEEK